MCLNGFHTRSFSELRHHFLLVNATHYRNMLSTPYFAPPFNSTPLDHTYEIIRKIYHALRLILLTFSRGSSLIRFTAVTIFYKNLGNSFPDCYISPGVIGNKHFQNIRHYFHFPTTILLCCESQQLCILSGRISPGLAAHVEDLHSQTDWHIRLATPEG